jgi:hypothetical protein
VSPNIQGQHGIFPVEICAGWSKMRNKSKKRARVKSRKTIENKGQSQFEAGWNGGC